MFSQLCTDQDVIDRFGGAAALRQCLDPTGTGNIDQAILNRAIDDASADVMAASGNKAKLWLLDTASIPRFVVRLVADRAIYYCWKYGTHGKGVPEAIQTAYEHNNEEMRLLEKVRKGLGGPVEPKDSTAISRVDNSHGGRRMVHTAWQRSGFV